MQTTDRLTKLTAMVDKTPADPFLHFAIAMEHKKLKQTTDAIRWFESTLEKDPGYCVAYHQAALTYEDAGDLDSAKKTYRDGIAAARKKGDHHAAEEMEAALSMIQ
jgi:tetratricopeptide (TPR) repeat protein